MKFIVQPTKRTLSPGAHGQDDGLGLDGHAAESIIIADPHVAPNLHGAETGDLDRGVTDGRSTLDDQIVRRIVTDVVQPGTDVQLQQLCSTLNCGTFIAISSSTTACSPSGHKENTAARDAFGATGVQFDGSDQLPSSGPVQ